MNNYRAFEVTFFGATDTKGSRIRIKDLRHNETKWLSRDYSCNGGEQALRYLASIGIEVIGRADYLDFSYIYFTEDYSISVKGGAL